MPEGDTIHALAGALGEALEERPVEALELRGERPPGELAGCRFGAVRARGKNLLVGVGEAAVLRVHLGMNGRWQRYPSRDPRGRRLGGADLRLATRTQSFRCLRAKTVELLRAGDVERYPPLAGLGPDLVVDRVDWEALGAAARERARGGDRPTLRELLLDQRVAAGIGNIFQTETLFSERLHPDTDPVALSAERLGAVYRRASELLRANVGAVPRIFTAGRPPLVGRGPQADRTLVYDRAGRPCRVCGTPIACRGDRGDDRVTWWCPTCQPPPARTVEP